MFVNSVLVLFFSACKCVCVIGKHAQPLLVCMQIYIDICFRN